MAQKNGPARISRPILTLAYNNRQFYEQPLTAPLFRHSFIRVERVATTAGCSSSDAADNIRR